jgi:hypothetical protein
MSQKRLSQQIVTFPFVCHSFFLIFSKPALHWMFQLMAKLHIPILETENMIQLQPLNVTMVIVLLLMLKLSNAEKSMLPLELVTVANGVLLR